MLGFHIGRVRGRSMLPRIQPDSFIIVFHFPRYFPKKAGQLYYLNHPQYGRIVKTLDRISDDGRSFYFRGESSESLSSEAMGALTHEAIIGRVICIVPPN